MNHLDAISESIYLAFNVKGAHYASYVVTESFIGQVIWEGVVEVYLVNHVDADRCYGWIVHDDEVVVILGKPPINCSRDAVKAYIINSQGRE